MTIFLVDFDRIVTVATHVERVFMRTIVEPETRQMREYLDEMATVTLAPLGTVTPERVAAEVAVMRLAVEASDSV